MSDLIYISNCLLTIEDIGIWLTIFLLTLVSSIHLYNFSVFKEDPSFIPSPFTETPLNKHHQSSSPKIRINFSFESLLDYLTFFSIFIFFNPRITNLVFLKHHINLCSHWFPLSHGQSSHSGTQRTTNLVLNFCQ